MLNNLTLNTQAILLLCAEFGLSRQTEPQPLNLAEYNQLVQKLRQANMQPADLLSDDGQAWVVNTLANPQRIVRLLKRGALLAIAVENWTNKGLWIICRSDDAYPQRLKDKLGYMAPPILYGVGNPDLLHAGGLAIIGCRDADTAGLEYTQHIAGACAEQNIQVISGGARGVDQAAMLAAIAAGGSAIGVLADSLLKAAVSIKYREGLRQGRLALISPYDPSAEFSVANAMNRNKYVYALAENALVVSAAYMKGGTWAGATEELGRDNAIPVWVRLDAGVPEGNRQLIRLGAKVMPNAVFDTIAEVVNLNEEVIMNKITVAILGNFAITVADIDGVVNKDEIQKVFVYDKLPVKDAVKAWAGDAIEMKELRPNYRTHNAFKMRARHVARNADRIIWFGDNIEADLLKECERVGRTVEVINVTVADQGGTAMINDIMRLRCLDNVNFGEIHTGDDVKGDALVAYVVIDKYGVAYPSTLASKGMPVMNKNGVASAPVDAAFVVHDGKVTRVRPWWHRDSNRPLARIYLPDDAYGDMMRLATGDKFVGVIIAHVKPGVTYNTKGQSLTTFHVVGDYVVGVLPLDRHPLPRIGEVPTAGGHDIVDDVKLQPIDNDTAAEVIDIDLDDMPPEIYESVAEVVDVNLDDLPAEVYDAAAEVIDIDLDDMPPEIYESVAEVVDVNLDNAVVLESVIEDTDMLQLALHNGDPFNVMRRRCAKLNANAFNMTPAELTNSVVNLGTDSEVLESLPVALRNRFERAAVNLRKRGDGDIVQLNKFEELYVRLVLRYNRGIFNQLYTVDDLNLVAGVLGIPVVTTDNRLVLQFGTDQQVVIKDGKVYIGNADNLNYCLPVLLNREFAGEKKFKLPEVDTTTDKLEFLTAPDKVSLLDGLSYIAALLVDSAIRNFNLQVLYSTLQEKVPTLAKIDANADDEDRMVLDFHTFHYKGRDICEVGPDVMTEFNIVLNKGHIVDGRLVSLRAKDFGDRAEEFVDMVLNRIGDPEAVIEGLRRKYVDLPHNAVAARQYLAKHLVVAYSEKANKLVKRCLMDMATVCKVANGQPRGVRYPLGNESTNNIVLPAVVSTAHAQLPGAAFFVNMKSPGAFTEWKTTLNIPYPTGDVKAYFEVNRTDADGWMVLTPVNPHHLFNADEVLVDVTMVDSIVYPVVNQVDGAMVKYIRYQITEEFFFKRMTLEVVVVTKDATMKLRNTVKAMCVEANEDIFRFNADLAGQPLLYLPVDTIKGKDRLYGAFFDMAVATAKANRGNAYAQPLVDAFDRIAKGGTVVLDPVAAIRGDYDAVLQIFEDLFCRWIWTVNTGAKDSAWALSKAMMVTETGHIVDGWLKLTVDEIAGLGFVDAAAEDVLFIAKGEGKQRLVWGWYRVGDTYYTVQGGYGYGRRNGCDVFAQVKAEYTAPVMVVGEANSMAGTLRTLALGRYPGVDQFLANCVNDMDNRIRGSLAIAWMGGIYGGRLDGYVKDLEVISVFEEDGSFNTELAELVNTHYDVFTHPQTIDCALKTLAPAFDGYLIKLMATETSHVAIHLPSLVKRAAGTGFRDKDSITDALYLLFMAIHANNVEFAKKMVTSVVNRLRMWAGPTGRISEKLLKEASYGPKVAQAKPAGVWGIPVNEVWVKASTSRQSTAYAMTRTFGCSYTELDGWKAIINRAPMAMAAGVTIRVKDYDWMHDDVMYMSIVNYTNRGDYDGDINTAMSLCYGRDEDGNPLFVGVPELTLDAIYASFAKSRGDDLRARIVNDSVKMGDEAYYVDHFTRKFVGAVKHLNTKFISLDTGHDLIKDEDSLPIKLFNSEWALTKLVGSAHEFMLTMDLTLSILNYLVAVCGKDAKLNTLDVNDAAAVEAMILQLSEMYEIPLGGYDKNSFRWFVRVLIPALRAKVSGQLPPLALAEVDAFADAGLRRDTYQTVLELLTLMPKNAKLAGVVRQVCYAVTYAFYLNRGKFPADGTETEATVTNHLLESLTDEQINGEPTLAMLRSFLAYNSGNKPILAPLNLEVKDVKESVIKAEAVAVADVDNFYGWYDRLPDEVKALNWSDLSTDQKLAVYHIVSGNHRVVGLLGRAGSGKSFTVKFAARVLEALNYNVVMLGTTGVASCNIDGAGTLNSFAHLGTGNMLPIGLYETSDNGMLCRQNTGTVVKRIRRDLANDRRPLVLFIDEMSMATAQLLYLFMNAVDAAVTDRKVRYVLVGDFRQLLPVALSKAPDQFAGWKEHNVLAFQDPEFFTVQEGKDRHHKFANIFSDGVVMSLVTNHRQKVDDPRAARFVEALNKLGDGVALTDPVMDIILERVYVRQPDGSYAQFRTGKPLPDNGLVDHKGLHIFIRNAEVKAMNDRIAEQAKADGVRFGTIHAKVKEGTFKRKEILEAVSPIHDATEVYVGMRFMVRQNLPKLGIANGTIGTVVDFGPNWLTLKLENDNNVTLRDVMVHLPVNAKGIPVGEFITAAPGHGANALTPWKVQGITVKQADTFGTDDYNYEDTVVAHVNKGWAQHGLLYVVASRVQSVDQLYLLIDNVDVLKGLSVANADVADFIRTAEHNTQTDIENLFVVQANLLSEVDQE